MSNGNKPSLCTRLRKHWIRWTILGTIGFVIFNIITVEFTSQSFFCNSCHIMNPFYDSWKVSKHADVECIKCHIPPGVNSYAMAKLNGLGQVVDDLLHRTSTKPSAAVSVFSCTREGCHNLNKMKEDDLLANRNSNDRPYLFNHEQHVDKSVLDIHMNCTTCHSHIKGGNHFEVNTNVCVTCHMIAKDSPATLAQKEKSAGTRVGKVFSSRIVFKPRHVEPLEKTEQSPVDEDTTLIVSTSPSNSNDNTTSPTNLALASSSPESDSIKPIHANPTNSDPPYRCRTCHTPPTEVVKYRGLEIDHRDFVTFGTTCESCHSGVTATPRVVDDTQCLSCHDYGAERVTNTTEIHNLHSEGEHKVECFSCHGITKHGPTAQSIRLERLNCTNCHERQHLVQFDTYASLEHNNTTPPKQHEELPAVSPMLLVHVDCSGCHVRRIQKPDGSAVIVAAPEACNTCHQTGFGEKMIPLWQNATHKLYDEVRKQYDDAVLHNGFNQIAKSHLKKAENLLNLVKFDGSWGVHNPQYTKRLLLSAQDELTLASKIRNISGGSEQ